MKSFHVDRMAITLAIALLSAMPASAQSKQMTRESVMAMTIDELTELPLEDVMRAVELLGVSSVDELFAIIMNKNVTSASKMEESAFTSPLATTVITQEEMRSYGCKTLEDAFRLIPGSIVTQKTNGVYDIQIRGLNNIPDGNLLLYTENSNVLLMIDGRVVHNYSIGTMTMENLPIGITDVERIEVVRGACSALYGVNAVNGVINIITRRPSDTQEKLSATATGGPGTYIAEAAYRVKLNDKIGIGVSGNFQLRKRNTDKLYAVPASDTYLMNDASVLEKTYTEEEVAELETAGLVTPIKSSKELGVERFADVVQLATSAKLDGREQFFYSTPEEYRDATKCFEDPELSRRNFGVNGYVDMRLTPDLTVQLTGGYSQSLAMQTTVMESPYSFAMREFKKGYANIDVRWQDLHVQANYYAGPENYAVGRPGLEAKYKQIFATAEYDLNVVEGLNIRPGINFQYMYGKDVKPGHGYSGFYNDDATLKSYAPSVRVDYRRKGWRFIAACRADKTSIPDKWNISLQGVVDYKISDKNFIRVNYGRGVRSANMLNANSNYKWERTGMTYPDVIEFFGNEEADLVSIDNFEIGYRWQPMQRLLVDAEVFYSRSKDYGAMMSMDSKAVTTYNNMYNSIANIWTTRSEEGEIDVNEALSTLMSNITNRSNSSYANLPYRVSQIGLSMNVDWIVTSKVVGKININVQQTKIDDYYMYNQTASLTEQFYGSEGVVANLGSALRDIVYCMEGRSSDGTEVISTDETKTGVKLATALAALSHSGDYTNIVGAMSDEQKSALYTALRNAYFTSDSYMYDKDGEYGPRKTTYQNSLALYYALKYGMDYNMSSKEYTFSQSHASETEQKNGHKHKSTPSVYGMAGVIVKPTEKINVAAYANFIGKRTYTTAYSTEELDNRVTINARIGYKPTDKMEITLSGDNLLNSRQREFVYSDKIGGVYTLGVNIGF